MVQHHNFDDEQHPAYGEFNEMCSKHGWFTPTKEQPKCTACIKDLLHKKVKGIFAKASVNHDPSVVKVCVGLLVALLNAGDMRKLAEYVAGLIHYKSYEEVFSKLTPLERMKVSLELMFYGQGN